MPRRRLGGSGFLYQNVVMKDLHGFRSHQFCGNFSCLRVSDHIFEFADAGPVAIVVKEPAALAILEILGGIRTRLGHVAVDACPNRINPVFEEPSYQHHAITLTGPDLVVCNLHFTAHLSAPTSHLLT